MLLPTGIFGDNVEEVWRFPLPGLRSFHVLRSHGEVESEVGSPSLNRRDFSQLVTVGRVLIFLALTRSVVLLISTLVRSRNRYHRNDAQFNLFFIKEGKSDG